MMYAFLEFWYLDLCTAERSFRWVERRSRFFDSVGAERSWEEEPAAHLSSFLSSQTCGLFRLRHERLFCLIPNILLEALVPWLWPVDVIIFEHNGFWKAEKKKTIRNTCNRKKCFRLTGSEIKCCLLEDLKKANFSSYQAVWFNRWSRINSFKICQKWSRL